MKLITLTILAISLAIDVEAQNFRQENFPFPPQFQSPNTGLFSSSSSLYLPPESHTTSPYFQIKDFNNLQFPYLPATGTKAPSIYPTPFPFMISSSLVPNFDDDDDEEAGTIRMSTIRPPQQKMNYTEKAADMLIKEKRELRPIPNMVFQQPIDRIDMRMPSNFPPPSPPTVTTQAPSSQTPAYRRMTISPEINRNDVSFDQIKAASFQGNQFIAAPPVFISSTTEPAIPILRLSNEMDLDGSFSYEALGADQTHYVQHSRMENMGTDKEEQVVEGSYSYVGDNGQTYTVHYIADSNGFRASGDHLPVAPPVPEIIQRSIQYNLAEEAKRPPHLKNWQDDGKDNQISDSDNNHNFIPPPRNLFTGRTPEAFSYSYSQGSNTQNNLVTSASSQVPIRTIDISTEQPKTKQNSGPISPQVTFLASQGAHLPSMNSVQNSISRMFTTEKPNTVMTQLVNYEAAVKDSDTESSKSLWRWQYGINANNLSQNQNKDTISRSFGEGDDVLINFRDMTAEQYANMIRPQFKTSSENVRPNQYTQSHQNIDNINHYQNQDANIQKNYHVQNQDQNVKNHYNKNTIRSQFELSSENVGPMKYSQGHQINNNQNNFINQNRNANVQKDFHVQSQDQNIKNDYVDMFRSKLETSAEILGPVQYTQSINDQDNYPNHKPDQIPKTNHNYNVKNEEQKLNNDYSHLIRSQFKTSEETVGPNQYTQSHQINENQINFANLNQVTNLEKDYQNQNHSIKNDNSVLKEERHPVVSTEITIMPDDWYKAYNVNYNSNFQTSVKPIESTEMVSDTKPKLITFNNFALPDQTVTQSYDFEEELYEPKKIKALNIDSTTKPFMNNNYDISVNNVVTNIAPNNLWSSTNENDARTTTAKVIPISTFNDIQLTNFIVHENKHDFKPILSTTTTETPRVLETTENNVENILQNNIFLKNLFKSDKPKPNIENKIREESNNISEEPNYLSEKPNNISEEPKKVFHTLIEAKPKQDKIPKFVQYHSKPVNEIKTFKKKPMDIADIINYVTMKNHFESSKIQSKSNPIGSNNFDHKSEIRFIPIQQESKDESKLNNPEPHTNNFRSLSHEQKEELRGIIKNYKVLRRNNSNINNSYDNNRELRRDLSPPPLIKTSPNLPPLGRAGPSMKSYLPPIYV